jgi:hypothetical protein
MSSILFDSAVYSFCFQNGLSYFVLQFKTTNKMSNTATLSNIALQVARYSASVVLLISAIPFVALSSVFALFISVPRMLIILDDDDTHIEEIVEVDSDSDVEETATAEAEETATAEAEETTAEDDEKGTDADNESSDTDTDSDLPALCALYTPERPITTNTQCPNAPNRSPNAPEHINEADDLPAGVEALPLHRKQLAFEFEIPDAYDPLTSS